MNTPNTHPSERPVKPPTGAYVRNARLTAPEIQFELLDICETLLHSKDCGKRTPGLQVAIDLLLFAWKRLEPERRKELISNFETRLTGYPFSLFINAGSFAPYPVGGAPDEGPDFNAEEGPDLNAEEAPDEEAPHPDEDVW